MGKVIFLMNVSLDGYIETPDHSLDWAIVDDELHTWFNDQIRAASVFVYGRRLWEVMAAYWPTSDSDPSATAPMLEFGRIWRARAKVVFSSTLSSVDGDARLVHGDVVDELPRLREEFDGEIQLAGPTLAAPLIRRGLIDEYRLVVHPVILGGGTPFFPDREAPLGLRLVDTRRFASGAVYLGYAVGGR
jgi:dihydrofolate reductase